MPKSAVRRLASLALLSLGLTPAAHAARWVELAPADSTRPVSRAAHTAVLDAPGRRMIAWGGRVPNDEVWALRLDGPPTWSRIRPAGTPPPRDFGGSAIFDPRRRRMLVFGGGLGESGFPFYNDVWALTLDATPRWDRLEPAGTRPSFREFHTAIYDPVRDRMLVFGGVSSVELPYATYENSVWELSLGDVPAWRQLAPTGTAPSPRIGASMVYDPARDRAIVFGGNNPTEPGTYTYKNDVFELTLGDTPAWRQLAPTGTPPSPRYEQAAVMDEARGRMLVFGGRGLNIIPTADAWALDLGVDPPAWLPAGPDAAFPRYHSMAILDPVTDRLIVDGGFVGSGTNQVDETIALRLEGSNAWQVLDAGVTPSSPPRRLAPVPLVDPVRKQLIVEGGYDYTTVGSFIDGYPRDEILTDLWTWSLDSATPTWTRQSNTQVPFLGTGRAVLDPVRRQQLRFFQDRLDPSTAASVGVLPLDGPGDWTALAVPGGQPEPRFDFSVTYDAVRDRFLLAGGYVIRGRYGYTRTFLHDVWALSLAGTPAWTQLRADSPDEPLFFPDALFFDPKGDQFVAMAVASDGHDLNGRSGTWVLAADGSSAWRFAAKLPLLYPSASFDPETRELVALDLDEGQGKAWHEVLTDDAGWVALDATGGPPPARFGTRAEFDPQHRRLLLFGGNGGGIEPLGDLWALELDRATPAVSASGPDHVRVEWVTNLGAGTTVGAERRVPDADWRALRELSTDAGGAVRYDDGDVSPGLAVDYRLRHGGTVLPGSEQHVIVAPRPPLALAGARPNPAVGAPQLAFTLTGLSPARLEVFDLAGRIMESRGVGALGAGEHLLGLEHRLAPGLYVAVLSQAGQRLAKRFVVAR